MNSKKSKGSRGRAKFSPLAGSVGLAPGTVVHVGESPDEKPKMTVFDYDVSHFEERAIESADACEAYRKAPTISWINIDGVHSPEIISKVGTCFGVHPLVLEDIANTTQRPKFENFDSYLFFVFKMLYLDENSEVMSEQVSLLLGENYVVSFQEKQGDVFEPVRNRIRADKGRVRKAGSDYLAYALLDAVVDYYFVILEKIGEKIEVLEEEIMANGSSQTLLGLHQLKKNLILLRKSVWPLREVIVSLEKSESSLIQKSTRPYLRDVYDHAIQVIDAVETYRDMVTGLMDVYLSSLSNRMNEVMKFLTIFSTIFIPLTFMAGIYGMNFRYMPELEWRGAYFVLLGLMAISAVSMLGYFKKRKWL